MGLRAYYAARAPEYDRVYDKPERQADLSALRAWLPEQFRDRRVLEVACGTGYWTQHIVPVARQVLALDASTETLAIAAARAALGQVNFTVGDAYALPMHPAKFDAGFAGFWFSHVPLKRRVEFLGGFCAALAPGAVVVMIDNRFVAGSNHPITHRDEDGNTFQTRHLQDGSEHRVLKNFTEPDEWDHLLEGLARDVSLLQLDHYWALRFTTLGPAATPT